MITIRTSAEITADRQVVVSLPPETPIGLANLVVTIAPLREATPADGGLRRRFGDVHGGDPRAADNERIDEDLAGEYNGVEE